MTDKKARRKKRHADKQALEQQARAYSWTPKEGQDRPTPERLARGAWRIVDGEDAGVGVAVDTEAHPIGKFYQAGLTNDEAVGAEKWADLYQRSGFHRGGRDCLTLHEPKGFDATDGDVRAYRQYLDLSKRLTRDQQSALWWVMIAEEMPPPPYLVPFMTACKVCEEFFARGR